MTPELLLRDTVTFDGRRDVALRSSTRCFRTVRDMHISRAMVQLDELLGDCVEWSKRLSADRSVRYLHACADDIGGVA